MSELRSYTTARLRAHTLLAQCGWQGCQERTWISASPRTGTALRPAHMLLLFQNMEHFLWLLLAPSSYVLGTHRIKIERIITEWEFRGTKVRCGDRSW